MGDSLDLIFNSVVGTRGGSAPLYLQLRKSIEDAVRDGVLTPGDALPSERDIAAKAVISRVTVRKALQDLVEQGVLIQRHGSGTFVAPRVEKVEQSLSRLTSFTEDMARRGKQVYSTWLEKGLYVPSPQETMVLGLTANEMVARMSRLRFADDSAVAIERASIGASLLPHPEEVGSSLYEALAALGNKPARAVQRISAANLGPEDAQLLRVPTGSASLNIERVSYLPSGKVVEFTRSIYRGDTYDFVAELRLAEPSEGEPH